MDQKPQTPQQPEKSVHETRKQLESLGLPTDESSPPAPRDQGAIPNVTGADVQPAAPVIKAAPPSRNVLDDDET